MSGELGVEGTGWGVVWLWVGCCAVHRWGAEGGAQIGKVVRRQSVTRIRLMQAVVVEGGAERAPGDTPRVGCCEKEVCRGDEGGFLVEVRCGGGQGDRP